MAGFKVTAVHENKCKIVNSDSQVFEGTIKDEFFVRNDGKKAEIIGALIGGFQRIHFRDGNGNDYVTSSGSILSLLDAIEKRKASEIKEQDYIVLSNWE